ncbi:capsule biosynthesis protein [Hyphomicrobium sp. 2TAF46]|uniref:capsule biosynthesis protein n=1 Tax=Hyphomicrobium sp. 2TAF46 TaxID=3233019 RepID=UPI003F9353CA
MTAADRAETIKRGADGARAASFRKQSETERGALSKYARLCLWLLPSILAIVYYGLVATDQYVSESQFVLRTSEKPAGSSGFGALLQMSGIGRVEDDVYSVQAFLSSRSAADSLAERLPVRKIYGPQSADFIARFPSIFFNDSKEEFYKYLNWMITTRYGTTTGIVTLNVHAFAPEDAKDVSLALLSLAEDVVNRMNVRMQEDAVRLAEQEVRRAEERMVSAQIAITQFRNKELMIDASGSAIVVVEVIARLEAERAQLEAQIREIAKGAGINPQLPGLRLRAEALQSQISAERQKISDPKDGIADQLARYERLLLDQQFAKESLTYVRRSLETAQQNARRQQLYLERIVEPTAPDSSMAPTRLKNIATVAGLNIVMVLVLWLVVSGFKEHVVESQHD